MKLDTLIEHTPRLLAPWLERLMRRIPAVQQRMEQEYDRLLAGLSTEVHPAPLMTQLPETGWPPEEVLTRLRALGQPEEQRWQAGYASGAVYHGDPAHIDLLNRAYALQSQSNPLHADLWPSTIQMEAEFIAMTARMLHGEPGVCGSVTSGGTESILMAMKTYRDWARDRKGITRPEIVLPVTAHPAFDKAAHYFGLRAVRVPVDAEFRADLDAVRRAISRRTVALVGSAPNYPYGTIDPIAEMAALAQERGIGFHTDACLGGFVLPWAEQLGYPVPPFDFRVPGVTSISVDTHKYGYAAKGTSVVLYRSPELRRYQYFTATEWPGGLYVSPTIAGSRPGGLIAACWAALTSIGEEGYLEATRRVLETAARIRKAVEAQPELRVLGDPLWVIAFASDEVDIYRVLDAMTARGWSLNGLHLPPAVHIAVTLQHTQPGVAERFAADLRAALDEVRANPQAEGGMAPIYGMAGSIPFRGMVDDLLRRYLDVLYPPPHDAQG